MTTDYNQGRIAEQYQHAKLEPYQSAVQDAGFREFAVHPPELAPDAEAGDDGACWDDFLNSPPAILIDCVKSDSRAA